MNDGTLESLLGALPRVDFERRFLHQCAWARPGAAMAQAERFGWRELGALLESIPRPDVLVVSRSQLLDEPEPRSLANLREQMSRGVGICVRRAERHHHEVARAAASLGGSFGANVHVQVFVTPAKTHGFGWHYDSEHVFIIQTAGSKDYYFRRNTVGWSGTQPNFSSIRHERSPLQTARLLAGDCLYLPAGFWHMAHCLEDSLSLSLGLRLEHTVPLPSKATAAM